MKKCTITILFIFCFMTQVFPQGTQVENPANPGSSTIPAVNQPAATTNDTPAPAAPAPEPTSAPKDLTPELNKKNSIPEGPVVSENTDLRAKESKERDLTRYGWDRRFVIPDGFRLTMDFKAMYSRQYDLEGGVGVDSQDIEHESFSSEGLFRFELGDGRFGVAAFIYSRNIGEKMEENWATYLGHNLPDLEPWIQTHYTVVAGEFMFRPFADQRLHLFAQLGWRNLGFEYSPKVPLHAIGGFRFSTGKYFNLSMWAGTEIGLEMGSMFWSGKDAEVGVYLKGNWLWNEEWRFDDIEFMRNVVEAEVGFKANLLGWLGFTLGGRHTWTYGWYPDERNAFGQRQPALRLDSFQLFAGIQLTF